MDKSFELGSNTAKNGFKNENDVIDKFNNWKKDEDATKWLFLMGYDLTEIEKVEAFILSGYKTDVQVQVNIKLKKIIDVQNLQVKLVSNLIGFNQIDKRWIDKYNEMWDIPKDVIVLLKLYSGEISPKVQNPKDRRRTFANEFSDLEKSKLLNWLDKNKTLIISDIIKGRGQFAAEWMLVIQKVNANSRWILKPINYCLNFFGNGEIEITKRGNIKIGRVTLQRKGGDRGRKTAQMLQFKINPAELFNIKDV